MTDSFDHSKYVSTLLGVLLVSLLGCQSIPNPGATTDALLVGVFEVDASALQFTPEDSSTAGSKLALEMIARNVSTRVEYKINVSLGNRAFFLMAPAGEYQIIELSTNTTKRSRISVFRKSLLGTDYFNLAANRVSDFGGFVWIISEAGRSSFFLRQRFSDEKIALTRELEKSAWKNFPIDDIKLYRYIGTEKFFHPKGAETE